MKVRILADVNLNQHILSGVLRRVPEIDFKTAHEANLHGLPDSQVLAIAAREGRILVTQGSANNARALWRIYWDQP